MIMNIMLEIYQMMYQRKIFGRLFESFGQGYIQNLFNTIS